MEEPHQGGEERAESMDTSSMDEINITASSSRGQNVLNRVGERQNKWKKQVLEQRKNIFDKHTMLN